MARSAAPALTIRTLRSADLDPLRWVIYRAYFDVLLELYGGEAAQQYEVRSLDFMALYLRRNPEGCFVAESEDGSLAGGLFCFVWGEVGWFGSLAVAPEWQGRGVGQQLTQTAVAYLRAQGCRRIGLETWPTLSLTRHLYEKLGFVRCEPTIKLSRSLPERRPKAPPPKDGAWQVTWTRSGDRDGLAVGLEAVRSVGRLVHTGAQAGEPRSDLEEEVRVAVAAGFAELVVVRGPEGAARAYALVYTRSPGGGQSRVVDTRLMMIGPEEAERTMDGLLVALERRGEELGCRAVTCDVNVRFERAVGMVRRRGFRQIYELVRMEVPVEGVDMRARSGVLEFARWAG